MAYCIVSYFAHPVENGWSCLAMSATDTAPNYEDDVNCLENVGPLALIGLALCNNMRVTKVLQACGKLLYQLYHVRLHKPVVFCLV